MPSFNIVGSHYRPPARIILDVLPSGARLTLRPEPDNPFDGNAIKVIVPGATLAELSPSARDKLAIAAPAYGLSIEELVAAPEWHLGYIPRAQAIALAIALAGEERPATLTFAAHGGPMATIDIVLPSSEELYNTATRGV